LISNGLVVLDKIILKHFPIGSYCCLWEGSSLIYVCLCHWGIGKKLFSQKFKIWMNTNYIKCMNYQEMVPYNSLIFCVDDQKSKMATTTGIPANSPIFWGFFPNSSVSYTKTMPCGCGYKCISNSWSKQKHLLQRII
jgi:hypothetical protein